MKATLPIAALLVLATTEARAHSGHDTHARVEVGADAVVVQVELPWTINEAAREHLGIRPGEHLDDASTARYLQTYLQTALTVYCRDAPLTATRVDVVPMPHAHSTGYRLRFTACARADLSMQSAIDLGPRTRHTVLVVDGDDAHRLRLEGRTALAPLTVAGVARGD